MDGDTDADGADVTWPAVTMEIFEGLLMLLFDSYDCRNAVTDTKKSGWRPVGYASRHHRCSRFNRMHRDSASTTTQTRFGIGTGSEHLCLYR